MSAEYASLSREETKKALQGTSSSRPPAHMHKWPGEGLVEYHGNKVWEVFEKYPTDVVMRSVVQPGMWEAPEGFDPEYRWAFKDKAAPEEEKGLDSGTQVLHDWSELDSFLENMPATDNPAIFAPVREAKAEAEGRYVLAQAFNYFYERLWGLRGMQNLLMDFYLFPDELERLCDGLLQFALGLVDGAAEAGADGLATSNDLGHQQGLMMHPDSFRTFLKPLHIRMANACHERGMDYWMHSCGNLTDIVEDLIEAGVDCLHPLQYGAMDWRNTARIINGRMTAWAGIDVQHILQEENPDGVRAHVRELLDTFYIAGAGKCVVAAGNGITGSTPLENIDAFLDETFRYGLEKTDSHLNSD